MKREFFLKADRFSLSRWEQKDIELTKLLWEKAKEHEHFWQIFDQADDKPIGFCGLNPNSKENYEVSFYLKSIFSQEGYLNRVVDTVLNHIIALLKSKELSLEAKKVSFNLKFIYINDNILDVNIPMHPSNELIR